MLYCACVSMCMVHGMGLWYSMYGPWRVLSPVNIQAGSLQHETVRETLSLLPFGWDYSDASDKLNLKLWALVSPLQVEHPSLVG